MNSEKFKELLDVCFAAKKITETMKELPKGLKPRHIHVVDCIYELSLKQTQVCVSNISKRMNITTPSITKLINELEEKNIVEKYSQEGDKRITLLRLTELGVSYQKNYVLEYHQQWLEGLNDITDVQVDMVIQIIKRLSDSIPQKEIGK